MVTILSTQKLRKMYYIFSKKRKSENTFLFKFYERIFSSLNILKQMNSSLKPIPLDIIFKQKFIEYLNRGKNIVVIEQNKRNIYKNKQDF